MTARTVIVPATEGELTHCLSTLEEVLLVLGPLDGTEAALPTAGPDELHALQRISMALFAAERAGTPQLYAPNGTFEYVPLIFFQALEEDLAAVGRAVAQFGAALLPGGDREMYEALGHFAEYGQSRQDLVVSFAQAHGILDLAPDDDSRFLVESLIKDRGARVVLSPAQDQAYGRFTQRLLDLQLNDPLARSLSRGGLSVPQRRAD